MKVDFGVLIGRFQPCHWGHVGLIKHALNSAGKLAILVGSANRPRLERNPWTASERIDILKAVLDDIDPDLVASRRVELRAVPDHIYDYQSWLSEVQHVIARRTAGYVKPSIGLFGHHRDHTSFYLDDFPDWESHLSESAGDGNVEATSVRKIYFQQATEDMFTSLGHLCPPPTVQFLQDWRNSKDFATLWEDIKENANYKKKWGLGPHSTVDSICLRSGHILMIKRGSAPGKGLWALPGGFLNADETLINGAIRELQEETKITFHESASAESVLLAAYKGRDIFDDPHRSERSRIITTAHLFDLGNGYLPPVVASDDALKGSATWVPLNQIRSDDTFDDHAFMISSMLRKFKATS